MTISPSCVILRLAHIDGATREGLLVVLGNGGVEVALPHDALRV